MAKAHIGEHSQGKRGCEEMKSSATGWRAKDIRGKDEDEGFDFRHVEFGVPVRHLGIDAQEKGEFPRLQPKGEVCPGNPCYQFPSTWHRA